MVRGKRFRTKRLWHNTKAWSYVGSALMVVGLVGSFSTGKVLFIVIATTILLAGYVMAYLRDRGNECQYIVDEKGLWLRTTGTDLRAGFDEIIDASLVDRSASRDYIRQFVKEDELKSETRAREQAFVQFCSVDIGLRSFTFGLGRRLIDRMPNSKDDLVLLRLSGGRHLVLSPQYNQDLVDTLTRALVSQRGKADSVTG
ncbi:MAG: hypothetical protein KA175_08010 [Flavobacteriales bacterium]|nr:hypothetical protein [Flavobacteriales bacterium]MBP6697547.1 hypothetical protein [Flavobacteriales bacterium]